MAAQDELFQLIKSLTPSEKRYFKVNGDTKSNYMQLFDAMDAQKEEYDEQKLKKKHAKKPFVKYLSAEKKQLREHIMKWMRAYRADSTVDNKINDLLQDEAFYRDKGLKTQRGKAILKAKELATKYERFHLLKEVLIRHTSFVVEFEPKKLSEPVLRLINEQKQLALKQETELELATKNYELFSMYRSGADMGNDLVLQRAEILMAEVERHRIRIGNSFVLGMSFLRASSDYNQLHRNWKVAFKNTNEEYQLFQTYPHFKLEDSYNYKLCLANLMARSLAVGNNDTFLKATKELKELPTKSFNEEGEVFQNVFFQEHLFYINQGEFEKAQSLIPEIEDGLLKYQDKINPARKLAFQFNITIMYFVMHDFKKALNCANGLLNSGSEMKQHQKFVTTLLLPIIHFELGHSELVESFARSAYRLLQKRNRLHSFERLIIKFLKNIPLSVSQPEFKPILKELYQSLTLLKEDPKIPMVMGMEEISLWANSHLTGVKMSEQLKLQTGSID